MSLGVNLMLGEMAKYQNVNYQSVNYLNVNYQNVYYQNANNQNVYYQNANNQNVYYQNANYQNVSYQKRNEYHMAILCSWSNIIKLFTSKKARLFVPARFSSLV
jgi:hypothetical protein